MAFGTTTDQSLVFGLWIQSPGRKTPVWLPHPAFSLYKATVTYGAVEIVHNFLLYMLL